MQILVLDDDPERHDYFRRELGRHMVLHTSTFRGAVLMLSSMAPFDVFYIDRDLNKFGAVSKDEKGEKQTGEDVIDFILHELPREQWPKKVIIHSHNDEAVPRMFKALDDAGIYTVIDRFPYVTVRWKPSMRWYE